MLTHDTGSGCAVCTCNREGSVADMKVITCRVTKLMIGLIEIGARWLIRGVLLEGRFKFLDRGREGGGVVRVGGVGVVECSVGVQGKVVQEWKLFIGVDSVSDDCVRADIEVEHVVIC